MAEQEPTPMIVDWAQLALDAKLASIAYIRDEPTAKQALEALWFEFVAIVGNGQCYVTICRKGGVTHFLIRGTQVMSGFSLSQLLDNERVMPVEVEGYEGAPMDGYWTPLQSLYDSELVKYVSSYMRVIGHSMGGVRALLTMALLPLATTAWIVAFAPPKGATMRFWQNAYMKRGLPMIVGRHDDFALNHPIVAAASYGYCQPGPILDIGRDDGNPCFVTDWPILNESIADHSVDLYVSDCTALAAH